MITLVSDIPLPAATYVGLDNYTAGRLAGELVGRFVGDEGGDILVIVGLMSMTDQHERQFAFSEILSERFPSCRIVEISESLESVTRPGEIVERALAENKELKAIYNTSTGVTSVARALEKHSVSKKIVFVGHELTEHRKVYLKSGTIDALIDQDPHQEVKTVFDVIASSHGRLHPSPASTEVPVRIFMRENC